MKKILVLIVLFGSANLSGQNVLRAFLRVSFPEKMWVIAHPFKAKAAFRETVYARELTDSTRKAGTFTDTLNNGGQIDAFRHACWMALVAKRIGTKKAL